MDSRRAWVALASLAVYVLAAIFVPAVATVLSGGMFGWSIARWAGEPGRLRLAEVRAVRLFVIELAKAPGGSSVHYTHQRGCTDAPCTCTPDVTYSFKTRPVAAHIVRDPN